jgi:hypothetical protein
VFLTGVYMLWAVVIAAAALGYEWWARRSGRVPGESKILANATAVEPTAHDAEPTAADVAVGALGPARRPEAEAAP